MFEPQVDDGDDSNYKNLSNLSFVCKGIWSEWLILRCTLAFMNCIRILYCLIIVFTGHFQLSFVQFGGTEVQGGKKKRLLLNIINVPKKTLSVIKRPVFPDHQNMVELLKGVTL